MRHILLATLALFFVGALSTVPAQDRPREELVDRVKKSIDKGVEFLRQKQRDNGSWEHTIPLAQFQCGETCLAILALLNAGVPPEDRMIQRGLKYLRGVQPTHTYSRALQTMAFAEAGQAVDRERIDENVRWLIKNRVIKEGKFIGWTYTSGMHGTADGSNTQYAVLGLLAGKQGGSIINKEIWESIRDLYVRTQNPTSGAWTYAEGVGPGRPAGSELTMTEAGICGLLIAAMELNSGREKDNGDGTFRNCGVYPEDKEIKKGLSWMARLVNFQLEMPLQTFYNLYGIERVGRLSGNRFIGPYDWYREGANWLTGETPGGRPRQDPKEGFWTGA